MELFESVPRADCPVLGTGVWYDIRSYFRSLRHARERFSSEGL